MGKMICGPGSCVLPHICLFSKPGLSYIGICHADWFPIPPHLFLVRTATVVRPTKLATCWSLIQPWENNLQMQQSTQSIIRITKQPSGSKDPHSQVMFIKPIFLV